MESLPRKAISEILNDKSSTNVDLDEGRNLKAKGRSQSLNLDYTERLNVSQKTEAMLSAWRNPHRPVNNPCHGSTSILVKAGSGVCALLTAYFILKCVNILLVEKHASPTSVAEDLVAPNSVELAAYPLASADSVLQSLDIHTQVIESLMARVADLEQDKQSFHKLQNRINDKLAKDEVLEFLDVNFTPIKSLELRFKLLYLWPKVQRRGERTADSNSFIRQAYQRLFNSKRVNFFSEETAGVPYCAKRKSLRIIFKVLRPASLRVLKVSLPNVG